jgi:hypothetical protein
MVKTRRTGHSCWEEAAPFIIKTFSTLALGANNIIKQAIVREAKITV